MEQKGENEIKNGEKKSQTAKSNKVLIWILGGCLVLFLITSLAIGGFAYWSLKKMKKEIKENQRKFEQAQQQAQNSAPAALTNTLPSQTLIPEEPVEDQNQDGGGVPDDIYSPEASEKAIGYLKKVYTKNGKNYIDIDYIQWLSGDTAEKAMREDGECPKKGECIVLNDYYIRNQNPLIRTFEVAPDAEILAHDFSSDYSTGNWNQSWNFYQFSQYFNSSVNNGYWDYAPFHVEIGNNQIIKISEQYIP